MAAAKWVLDKAHSSVEFSIKHMMISTVKGRFEKFDGSLEGDLDDLTTATITATVDTSSIHTNEEKRDAHLRSADFFDAEHNPTLTFVSTNIERVDGNEYKVTGDLTMHGETHPVTLDLLYEGSAKTPWGTTVAAVSLEGKLSRKEWSLNYNAVLEAGGLLVGDVVKLTIHAELMQPVAAQA